MIGLRKKTPAEETLAEIVKRLDAFEAACRAIGEWKPDTKPDSALVVAIRDYIRSRA